MSAAARSHIHGADAREDWQEEEPASIHRSSGHWGGGSGQHVYARLGNVMPWSASVYQACIGLQISDSETETAQQ